MELLLLGILCLLEPCCVVDAKGTNLNVNEREERHSVCFKGNNIMKANCTEEEFIAVKRVMGGIKNKTSNCSTSSRPMCCVADESKDCFKEDTVNRYKSPCSGKHICDPAHAASQLDGYSVCDHSRYDRYTNYMFIDYYCIKARHVYEVCSNHSAKLTGSPMYIWTHYYNFSEPLKIENRYCSCSIEVEDCTSTITVFAIDLQLNSTNNQTLMFSGENQKQNITSANNSEFKIVHLYTQNSSFIKMELFNSAIVNGGLFWIGFQASTTNTTMRLKCPAEERKYLCTTTTSTTKEATSLNPKTTTGSGTSYNVQTNSSATPLVLPRIQAATLRNKEDLATEAPKSQENEKFGLRSVILAAAVPGAAFLITAVVAVIAIYHWCKSCNAKVSPETVAANKKLDTEDDSSYGNYNVKEKTKKRLDTDKDIIQGNKFPPPKNLLTPLKPPVHEGHALTNDDSANISKDRLNRGDPEQTNGHSNDNQKKKKKKKKNGKGKNIPPNESTGEITRTDSPVRNDNADVVALSNSSHEKALENANVAGHKNEDEEYNLKTQSTISVDADEQELHSH